MDDFTSALKEALDGGKSLDEAAKEILRKQTEKAVNTIIRERGVKRCDVVVSDGFVGMKEIVRGRFPDCRYQRCFVHLARNAGDMVRPSGRQSIMADFMSLAKLGGKEEAVAGLASSARTGPGNTHPSAAGSTGRRKTTPSPSTPSARRCATSPIRTTGSRPSTPRSSARRRSISNGQGGGRGKVPHQPRQLLQPQEMEAEGERLEVS